MSVW